MIVLYILLGVLGGIFALILAIALFYFICSMFVNPNKEYKENSRFYRFLLNTFSGVGLWVLRVNVHISGMEKVPAGQRLVFVGNHVSNYDPIITWYVFRKWDIAYISKDGNFKIPIFGRFIRKCCFMAIDRENPRKALKTIHNAAELLKKDEVSIGVYPEGTRSKTGELLPFHDGVFYIAKKANVPIAVISIKGTENIHKNILLRRTDVYLNVVELISADEVKEMNTHDIGLQVREALSMQKADVSEKKEVITI